MDLATYAAANGLTVKECEEVLRAMYEPQHADARVRDTLQSVLYGAGYQGTVRSRPNRVGAARKPPLAYTHR
jgi:hypothetical protein